MSTSRPARSPTGGELGLRFIVFGVPRSGTKGLVRAINLHPNVLCASERFSYRRDHSQLRYPSDFLTKQRIMHPVDSRKVDLLREQAESKPSILYVGNKEPRYYFALDRLNAEISGLRNILIYRSPYGVIPSWDRKELAHPDSSWRAGAIGLFGFLELLTCLQNVARRPDIFIFPYEHGLNESPEPMLATLDFIGADPTLFDARTFVESHLPRKRRNKRRLALEAHEEMFLEEVCAQELDEIMKGICGVMTRDTASQLNAYLRSISEVLPHALDRAFSEHRSAAAELYGARYVHARREELMGLFELTEGSRVMERLGQFGPWEKVRYLYLQRSILLRRLISQ